MAARRTTGRSKAPAKPRTRKCPLCQGTGEVPAATPVRTLPGKTAARDGQTGLFEVAADTTPNPTK
ncbi:hypothetical protein AB0I84_38720 [Streptomyces spectabilis]|uniref:hypothetical protein n=1 Tax=Streptomyces spectabilis TaxID=68270 RepID=UPI0033E1CEE7